MDWKSILTRRPRLTPDLEERIRRSFDEASRDEEHFPSTIDPRIYHVKLLLDHLGDLSGKRALDVGCGKGRFTRIFQEHYPDAEMWGLDISIGDAEARPRRNPHLRRIDDGAAV